jgi:two-component system sensor histidine kinase UhpB
MNLQIHLLSRIALVALLCLLASTAYVLVHSDRQARAVTQRISESLVKQLELQLWRSNAGFNQGKHFPDFELWKQTTSIPGVCVSFVAINSVSRSLCTGTTQAGVDYPEEFQRFYRWLLQPGLALTRTISFNRQVYGALTVTPSAEMEIAQAWNNLGHLLGLSIITVLAVCLLVYLSMSRALRPAQIIVAGLERMQQGHLAERLPVFELNEWQRTATAINQLAASQQHLLAERQRLSIQLINLQEEERRYLARELHDEFGQCLAAINALAASIAQTADQQCPEVLDEAGQISRIAQHMLTNVRELLTRLRPAELDELGLAASLNSLVSRWNIHSAGKINYQLNITGDCGILSDVLVVTLFRISQECLTNIAKHAAATQAALNLTVNPDKVNLSVADNGKTTRLPFVECSGIGLLGIHERVAALNGQLSLSLAQPHGLIVNLWLPIIPMTKSQV